MSNIYSIMYEDYTNIDSLMATPQALRDRKFHDVVMPPPIPKVEAPTLTLETRGKRYLVSPADIEAKNIQLCIQNDDKLITFLSSIKGRRANVGVIFSIANVVTVLVKSNEMHPVLVMRYPIDGAKIYARAADLVFSLPLDDIIQRISQGNSANGYALYYQKSIDESKQTIITLHYLINKNNGKNGETNSPPIHDVTMDYVNTLLQPSPLLDTHIREDTRAEDNINNLNNISIIMLTAVDGPEEFKEMGKGSEIDFYITRDESGISTMISCSRAASGFEDKNTVTSDDKAIVWKFRNEAIYHMDKKTVLLLQAANQKIKLGTDYLYFVFGRYGSDYVFLKLISSRAITRRELTGPVLKLSEILNGTIHIFEMYFCGE